MKRVNHMLTEQQVEEIRRVSEITGLSYSEIIRRAVDEWLRTESEKRPLPKRSVKTDVLRVSDSGDG